MSTYSTPGPELAGLLEAATERYLEQFLVPTDALEFVDFKRQALMAVDTPHG